MRALRVGRERRGWRRRRTRVGKAGRTRADMVAGGGGVVVCDNVLSTFGLV